MTNPQIRSEGRQGSFLVLTSLFLIFSMLLTGCGPSAADLEAVDYTPSAGDDWQVSTPAEQGLDPELVAEAYYNAAKLDTLYSLLIIKNDQLIAEGYFTEGSREHKNLMQSASKSYISALIGIALDQGCLSSLHQNMLEFFPEYADQITDPRKKRDHNPAVAANAFRISLGGNTSRPDGGDVGR